MKGIRILNNSVFTDLWLNKFQYLIYCPLTLSMLQPQHALNLFLISDQFSGSFSLKNALLKGILFSDFCQRTINFQIPGGRGRPDSVP